MATPTNKESTRFTSLKVQATRSDSNTQAKVPMVIKAVSGQTADLFQLQDSSGNVLYKLDANGRGALTPAGKTIVDGSATALFDVACAAGAMVGGTIHYVVRASDGADFQALSGIVTYSAVNKAGTLTLTITEVTANQAKAVSSGTLTLAWTFVTGTNKGTVKLQPTGSLTETTYDVSFSVTQTQGAITIL